MKKLFNNKLKENKERVINLRCKPTLINTKKNLHALYYGNLLFVIPIGRCNASMCL